MASSVSEVAKNILKKNAIAIPQDVPLDQQERLITAVTIMQGSIWEYSDSQPWFLVGLRKNNPTATRHVLESMIHFKDKSVPQQPHLRRGTLSLTSARVDSQGHRILSPTDSESEKSSGHADLHCEATRVKPMSVVAQAMLTNQSHFGGSPQTKIVITKTVELIGDMSKSCELVFHAVRACARFLTYPTPSVPSDNFVFGHIKAWIWLIYKGISHFSFDKTDKKGLDLCIKVFRKEMSLLASEVYSCFKEISSFLSDLRKLNGIIRKEAKFLKRKHKPIWQVQMDRYLRFVDDVKAQDELLVDVHEDRFFPTDWMFEPHPSQTKLHWDFFHFQWVDLKRDWIDAEFEVRSDYSLHWVPFTEFSAKLQAELITHLIHHGRALIEEIRKFQRVNLQLSFDSQEVKFLKFAVQEICKLKSQQESIEFITGVAKKLFEDLTILERIVEEYKVHMEWLKLVIEPCYYTMNQWLTDDLVLPLEFPMRRNKLSRKQWGCGCFRRSKQFLELFGQPLEVVMLRSPISIEQRDRFFPPSYRLPGETILPSSAINSFGVSEGYASSLFDAGIGRGVPLPIHHPLPKYKRRPQQTYNIFDIHRLIESSADCVIIRPLALAQHKVGGGLDVDIEKYLALMGEVQRFLAVYSSIYNGMMVELKERMEVLESLIYNNLPEHYDSLIDMIVHEIGTGRPWESSDDSGIKAFGRLSKIFQFVVLFMEKLVTLEENEITYFASKSAYYKSFGKVQGWIYQKAAVFAMYSLPNKQETFQSLFSDAERAAGVEKRISEFLDHGRRLIEISENIFKGYNLAIQ